MLYAYFPFKLTPTTVSSLVVYKIDSMCKESNIIEANILLNRHKTNRGYFFSNIPFQSFPFLISRMVNLTSIMLDINVNVISQFTSLIQSSEILLFG